MSPPSHHRSDERVRIVGLFLFFLLVIAAFWIQKPIRTSRFLAALGPQQLPWVKLGTAVLILPVVLLYSSVAAHYRREYIVYGCCAVFAACSLFFASRSALVPTAVISSTPKFWQCATNCSSTLAARPCASGEIKPV